MPDSITSTPVPIHTTKFSTTNEPEQKIDSENFLKESQVKIYYFLLSVDNIVM